MVTQLGLAAAPRRTAAFLSMFSRGKVPLLLIIIHACSPTAHTMFAYVVKSLILVFRSLPDRCDPPERPASQYQTLQSSGKEAYFHVKRFVCCNMAKCRQLVRQ